MRLASILVASALAVGVACGGNDAPSDPSPESVLGVITEIEPDEGGPVERFTVTEEDGDVYELQIDPELNYGFDLNHLYEHLDSEDPVDVQVHSTGDELIAHSIEDV